MLHGEAASVFIFPRHHPSHRYPLPVLIRTVRMTFHPERVPDFLTLFAAARPEIAAQPGCRHLALWQDARYPNVLTTYSHWDDADALNAYRRSELFTSTWAKTKPLFAAPPAAHSQHERAV